MISATRRWLRRNQNGIAVAAGVVGATYMAGQYVVGKIAEARERMTFDRLARENLRRRFEQNQTDCTFTVLALLPNVTENVLEALPVEQLTQELQQRKSNRLARSGGDVTPSEPSSGPVSIREGDTTASLSSFQSSSYVHASQLAHSEGDSDRPRKSKAQLWNEIKISSIARAFTLLYTLSLLTLLTRVQLNLLGRLNYLSSVISLARPSPPESAHAISLQDNDSPGSPGVPGAGVGNDFETNRRYLAFTWFLLNKGYKVLLSEVQAAVSEIFGSVSPTEAVTAARLSSLTLLVRQRVEGATAEDRRAKNWLAYLLPPGDEEADLLIQSGVSTAAAAAAAPATTSTSPATSPDQKNSSSQRDPSSTIISEEAGLADPTSPLRRLLDETSDLIESPTFTRIHSLLLDSLFSHLIERRVIEQAFPSTSSSPPPPPPPPPPPQQQQPIPEIPSAVTVIPTTTTNTTTTNQSSSSPSSPSSPAPSATPAPATNPTSNTDNQPTKLATILAIVTRQAHVIGNGNHPPNEYVQVMEGEVRELDAFAAVVYGRGEEDFRDGEGGEGGENGENGGGNDGDGGGRGAGGGGWGWGWWW